MNPLAATHAEPTTAERIGERRPGPVLALLETLRGSVPLAWRLSCIMILGALAAAAVAATTAENPVASPGSVAVELRVAMIVALIGAGLYAQTSKIQARMGGLLIGAGFYSSLWLLNGSSNRILFSIGVVASSVAPLVFAYLMLAHPTGQLFHRREARFLLLTGGSAAMVWLLGVAMTLQPPLKSPLLQCTPHCPPNIFSLGSANAAVGVVQAAIFVAWLALSVVTPILLARRAAASPAPVRRSLHPVVIIAALVPVLLALYTTSVLTGRGPTAVLGGLYIAEVVAIPVAILAGLYHERLFMGQTLVDLVNQLARSPQADPEALMAAALRDPSLRIAYRRPGRGTYVDSRGSAMSEFPDDVAVAWIEREGAPVAVVLYNRDLARDERFVQAAGAAALIRLEKAQFEAELKASTADLAASRVRLMEAADAERRRLERDLHDGVQQHLVGLRITLEMAVEAVKDDPIQGGRMLASVGQQMDDLLHEVRSLARGIYPALLTERGIGEAIRAAARSSPVVVEVRGRVGRYSEDVEVAVYFCCLEALQNVAKHGGPGVTATVTLREHDRRLCFEVRDSGVGFDPSTVRSGNGLTNMRDRIEAVGGTLEVISRRLAGSFVRGSVPVA